MKLGFICLNLPGHLKKTGLVTSLDELTSDHLSTLLDEVLKNSTYRDNARKLQKAITKANGLSVAADLVEESLSGTKKAGKEQLKEELRAV